jgi:hypothetical protein
MTHIADGSLRRLRDEPQLLGDTERRHLETCDACRTRQSEIATTAGAAAAAFAAPLPSVSSTVALSRLRSRLETEGVRPRRTSGVLRAVRRPVAGLAAALVLVGAGLWTPAGSLAQQFITIFQPAEVTPVHLTSADFQSLSELARYGTIHMPARTSTAPVKSAAAAGRGSGMHVRVPASLPAGVTSAPTYSVVAGGTVSFTFNAGKARRQAKLSGATLPPMPAGMNGSTLTATIPTGVLTVYPKQGDLPQLAIGQMRVPVVRSTGVTVRQIEEYVAGLPGISPRLATELRSIGDPTTTLPIPIAVDHTQAHNVQVQGVHGLAIGDNTGVGSGVIWEKDGMIYGVAGAMTESDLLAVANSLH